jgi:hypothetical protein
MLQATSGNASGRLGTAGPGVRDLRHVQRAAAGYRRQHERRLRQRVQERERCADRPCGLLAAIKVGSLVKARADLGGAGLAWNRMEIEG